MKVGYQGVPGAYSEVATIKVFGMEEEGNEYIGYDAFDELMENVSNGFLDFAVIPIENSTTGIIYRTMDLLKNNDLVADYETFVKIDHALIGHPHAEIEQLTEVFSHPEALSQCQKLFAHATFSQTTYVDTAKSVEYIKDLGDKTKGALASVRSAEIYGMKILKEAVQDNKSNTTRFLVFRKDDGTFFLGNKMSVYFELEHAVGTLSSILNLFREHGLNVASLQSRPLENENFRYGFFADVESTLDEFPLDAFTNLVKSYKILGVYELIK